MAKAYVRDNVPLSRFGVLVAQLESIVFTSAHKSPHPLLCFDLLSDLISAINEEPKESLILWQRKCEDALYSLIVLGARRPVRHLASVAMSMIILKGDSISIYSRASTLQGFLSDGRKNEPLRVAGAAQCLGYLYRHFGRKITSGLLETTAIVTKLMRYNEDFVRQEALQMLWNALEGSGGNAAFPAYAEAFRLIMRLAIGDKSFIVRIAAARCLTAFANIGGPGLGVVDIDNSSSYCMKALEDPVSSVRDAFAEALGALLALGMNPEAQVQPKGKGNVAPKKLEGGLQKHLILPFTKASGPRSKNLRIGLTLSWVFFLQAIRVKYLHPDSELQNFVVPIMDMLRADASVDAQAVACVLYILRVGVTDQMSEPTQRGFLVLLGKQLQAPDASPAIQIASLRTLSYALKTLGEAPPEFKEVLDNTVVAALSHPSPLVRVEAALTWRALAEVDPTCVGGLISFGVTTLSALRENVAFEKGSNLQYELDSLHGQATVLAALMSISPKLPLGYPARLPRSVLDVSKKMLTESSRNPVVATVEKEAGWLLLSSLLGSMPKEEMEYQVFDILSLWTPVFSRDPENQINKEEDLSSAISVWAASIDALTAFIKSFLSPGDVNQKILLQPVLLYLSLALSYVSVLSAKEQPNIKQALDLFTIRILIAYSSLSDPMTYKSDHQQVIQICTTPFRDASACEESSCLRMLLDKRDAWLGPWIPGRDWFEDELRAFEGGKTGILPCVWENETPIFPQPETISKMLVNHMILGFGTMFACQDSRGMLSLFGMIDQCLKSGRRQAWHAASVTNICAALLSGLKALLTLRSHPLGMEILNAAQTIFQSILAEGEISESQRRASSEGLGMLTRLGNDMFTARLTRFLLGDVTGGMDSNYAGSVALAIGCIHRSAGGMALSSLVPSTVNFLSTLARSSAAGLQIWSLHGLLLTIESAGLSYVSHVQATLSLAMDILLSEENGRVELQQGVGRLINAIVAVLGPELSPGSMFFSRCKYVIAEISSHQEIATLLESVRFTQQLVLFAPHAVTVHFHVQNLLPNLSSRQPTLRHLAVSTLRHLIEKDPVSCKASVIDEQIEDTLFLMLDEETDIEIGGLVRSTIMRLLHASCPSFPSHWLSICRNMILATSTRRGDNNLTHDHVNGTDGETRTELGEDDENMVSRSNSSPVVRARRDKHLRYRTRVFAAECLSHIPEAVGKNPAHFDLSLARSHGSGDWLVIQVQELISLAYQISTIQFENLRPIGVGLLSTIVDKFGMIQDPELPGRLLLEQYQAQLISAVRTALDESSGPILLEAGLQLATKMLTSGIISGDQIAVKRIFFLISRPLDDFKDLYYPSFAEWVSCKIKIRLLTAHASLKCYTYAFLRRQRSGIPDEHLALLPLFAKSSSLLGKYWIRTLKDYSYVCFRLQTKSDWKPFLDGIQSSLVSSKLEQCLEEAWPVILQAVALDAVPVNFSENGFSSDKENSSKGELYSGYSMAELDSKEYQFLWGFALLVLFQGRDKLDKNIIPVGSVKSNTGKHSLAEDTLTALKLYEIVLPVFQFLSTKRFFSNEFLTMDVCEELLQVFFYSTYMEDTWDSLAISVLSQIVQNCPREFLEADKFSYLAAELCLAFLFKFLRSANATSPCLPSCEDMISVSLTAAKEILSRSAIKKQLQLMLAYVLMGYKCTEGASTESCFSKANEFLQSTSHILKDQVDEKSKLGEDGISLLRTIIGACIDLFINLTKDCIKSIHLVENKKSNSCKLLQMKLAFSLEQMTSFAKLAYEVESFGDNDESKPMLYTVLSNCTRCIQASLTDQEKQVKLVGLQVLRSILLHGNHGESSCFIIFFISEILKDVLTIVQQNLVKPINMEAVLVTGECLKILMLLQTLSSSTECQKGLMHLLLEVVVLVILTTETDNSQEAKDLRNTAVRLVSQLAQIPKSATYFKDVLLAMPAGRREQLQAVIRASVMQDQKATQIKSSTPQLVIKLPPQAEEIKDRMVSSSSPKEHETSSEEEEDDDWDTFQSIPASANEVDPSTKVEETNEVDPSAEVEETNEVDPSTKVEETNEVDPSIKEEETDEVDPSTEVEETNGIDPSTKVAETNEVDPSTKVEETNEVDPSTKVEETNEVDPSTKVKEANKKPVSDVSTEDTEFLDERELSSAVERTDERKDLNSNFEEGHSKVNMEEDEVEGKDITDD
ncbi:hypothetical protein AgCh_011749 [Apium graveolens]